MWIWAILTLLCKDHHKDAHQEPLEFDQEGDSRLPTWESHCVLEDELDEGPEVVNPVSSMRDPFLKGSSPLGKANSSVRCSLCYLEKMDSQNWTAKKSSPKGGQWECWMIEVDGVSEEKPLRRKDSGITFYLTSPRKHHSCISVVQLGLGRHVILGRVWCQDGN
jgi:hypothetical protein